MATRPFEISQEHETVIYGGSKGDVSLYANGTYQPIITWKIPRQMLWSLIKNPKVRMKLYDKATGEEISPNVKLGLSIRKPGQELFQEIFTTKQYSSYYALSEADQLNKDYDPSVRFNLKQAGSFPEDSEMTMLAKVSADVTIDWSKSTIYIGEASKLDLTETDL